jgi:hypothetical protein
MLKDMGSNRRHLNTSMNESVLPRSDSSGWGGHIRSPIDGAPRYQALSYTWGNPKRTHSISVDGQRLEITKSAHEALHDLVPFGGSRLIWVDSICIYSQRTAMKDLGTLRFAPQFSEEFNSTHIANRIWEIHSSGRAIWLLDRHPQRKITGCRCCRCIQYGVQDAS